MSEEMIKAIRIKCNSWDEFIFKLRKHTGRVFGERLYRGQRNIEWNLSSHWERRRFKSKDRIKTNNPSKVAPKRSHIDYCKSLYLDKFKRLIIGLPGVKTDLLKNENDLWALARHHGLITPLLDWTLSPYIAAFFAFADRLDEIAPSITRANIEQRQFTNKIDPIAVWCLTFHKTIEGNDLVKEGEFEIIQNQKDFFHRQRAQRGVFTRLAHDVYTDIESYLIDRGKADYLECFEIPGNEIITALYDLRQMNITYATLFPDLDGAAKEVNVNSILSNLNYLAEIFDCPSLNQID